MRTLVAVGLCLLASLATGCKSLGPTPEQSAAMLEAYKTFAAQQRMGDVIQVIGSAEKPASLTATGERIVISTPLPALQVMPPEGDRGYDTIQAVASEAARLGMFAAGAYLLHDTLGGNTTIHKYEPAPTTP